MITKNDRPACREAEWSHQRWVTWLPPCSLYLLRKTLVQRYAKAGGWDDPWGFGWRCEGSSRPECSLSHWVSRLTWPVRPSTDQAFILRLQLLIKLPFDPLEFLNRSPSDSLLTRPAFFHFVLNGGSGFRSQWWRVWWTVYSYVYMFSSLSTTIMAHWGDDLKLLLWRNRMTDILTCIWLWISISILYVISSGWIFTCCVFVWEREKNRGSGKRKDG